MIWFSRLFFSCLFLFFSLGIFAQLPADFVAEIEKLKNDPELKHASWSLNIAEAKSGRKIFSLNEQMCLSPASTLKLFTTACALEVLGSAYVYKTYILTDGSIKDSVLQGNLIIRGSGDPTLESEYFKNPGEGNKSLEHIHATLKKLGVKKINGNIISDVSAFDDAVTPVNWLWADIGNYYGAGPSGLNYKDNKFEVRFKSGPNPGDSTYIVKVDPKPEGLKLINLVKSGTPGSGDNAYFYGAEFQPLRIVKGTVPPGKESFKVESALPDAAHLFSQELKSFLAQKGIETEGEASTSRILSYYGYKGSKNNNIIDSLVSPPLKQIVYFTNMRSLNLYAESLVKSLSLISDKQGVTADGIKVIELFLKNNKVDISGLKMQDGSGLSPVNKVTTQHQVDLLNVMAKSKSYEVFVASLPVAGKTGSLAGMCKGTRAEGNIKAKSGYIGGVRSYAGYFTNPKGELMSFSFIVNNYDCSANEMKRKMESIMTKMVDLY